MTTHDHPGETDSPNYVDPPAGSRGTAFDRSGASRSADPSMSPTATNDPGWQRQADEFAANRGEYTAANSSPAQPDSALSPEGGSLDLDDDRRRSDQSSRDSSLFADTGLTEFRRGWDNVQAGFVDDPRRCVEQADGLVSDVVEQLSSGFAEARSRLEHRWSRGEAASTEDLRIALKRYREFFDRLLAV